MSRKFRPAGFEGQVISIEAAREQRNVIAQERERVMNRLLTLSEEEIAKVSDLVLFTNQKFHRRAFVEKEEGHLHATDEIDKTVSWLNEGNKSRLEELTESGITPEMLKGDLSVIAENFFIFANELNDLKRVELDLVVWKQEYEGLIEELYKTTQLETNAGNSLMENRDSSQLSTEIGDKRRALVKVVRQAFGINMEEWMEYVNEHT